MIKGYAVWRLLNGKSKYESLTEANQVEFDEIMKLCKEIGIETAGDLDRFVKEVGEDGTLLDKLRAYRAELGDDFEIKEELNLDHGYPHIKSVATIVHDAINNYTKDNRVGTCEDGTAIYVVISKASGNPDKAKKIILDTLADNSYEPEKLEFKETATAFGYLIGDIKMLAKAKMAYQKNEALTEDVEETENEPISNDPEEKPSKPVKMANTADTKGMDFEVACQKFGISLEN